MNSIARAQFLTISKRLRSATAISRPLPSPPQLTSDKISLSDEKIGCYCKTAALNRIDDARKLAEENIAIMLHKCKTIKQLKQVHLQILINCIRSDDDDINNSNYSFLAEKLMLFSSDLISFDYAYRVFMALPSNPSLSSYNTLIKCSIGKSDKIAASAYNRMLSNVISPDRFTFAFLFKSFASSYRIKSGKSVHGHVIKLGFVSSTFVLNFLLEFYFEFIGGRNQLRAVRKVFDEIPVRDVVSWNTMISNLGCKWLHFEAFLVFDELLLSDDHRCKPDETTLINILSACTHGAFMEQGKWLDSYIKENKFVLSVPLGNALIDMFVSFEDLVNAKMVFKSMSKRCTHTWQMMMSILAEKGFYKEALVLFDTMCCCSEEEGGLKPDDTTFLSVLHVFRMDGRLVGDGKRLFQAIHKMVHGFGIKPNKEHYETMVIILSQAGWVEAAMMLAESLPWEPDSFVWGSVLFSCQVHGNNSLLDSCIRKISGINSKQDRPRNFMEWTLSSYIQCAFNQKHNDDNNYIKSMAELLITKLPDQKHVEVFNKDLDASMEVNAYSGSYNQLHECGMLVHAPETLPPHENDDDVYKVVESLDRQLLDLHDQMNNIINDPCQRFDDWWFLATT